MRTITHSTFLKTAFTVLSAILLALTALPYRAGALTVAPARLEINVNPGETFSGEFLLINEQETEKTFYSSYANFEAQGETGTPNFVPADEGLGTWIETQESAVLSPGEQAEVPFTITVPEVAEPGGYFAAIFWGTNPVGESEDAQVSVGAKVGILVLLRVNGEIEEGGGIDGFATVAGKRAFTSLPVEFTYLFRNGGGDRVKPEGDIVVRNTFGLTAATIPANVAEGNVLPTSARRFSAVWGEEEALTERTFFGEVGYQARNFALGRYTANLNLTYGRQALTDSASVSFWVFPWQLILVTLTGLALLYVVVGVGLKRHNERVIARARREWEVAE